MDDGLIDLPAVGQNAGEVVVGVGVVGPISRACGKAAIASSTRPQPTRALPRLLYANASSDLTSSARR